MVSGMNFTSHTTAKDAVEALVALYDRNVTTLREAFAGFSRGQIPPERVRVTYPMLRLTITQPPTVDPRLAYGFCSSPGVYETTITRPDLFRSYLTKQLKLLLENHGCPIEVGPSQTPIPIHFALGDGYHAEGDLDQQRLELVPRLFDLPDLTIMDDAIANGTAGVSATGAHPLALFTAPRIDVSLLRLRHYTGTSAGHFQNFVIFTNYQFYVDEFVRIAHGLLAKADHPTLAADHARYTSFVEPGDVITLNENLPLSENPDRDVVQGKAPPRTPQMPAWHLKMNDHSGITMINIGVGPSNAKTITDHVAVLRPHAWLMLGHCAGLRNSQALGDYALAHAYLRNDHVLDRDLPVDIPIPALAEVQTALERAVSEVTGLKGYDLKRIMRTGTVATVDDRNWELAPSAVQNLPLSRSRAVALDMESGTIAANGFRFRVPYGTLLCVSDKPLHGQLKLPGMADTFYRQRVKQHLEIGLLAMKLLRETEPEQLHSRKLRSFDETAFQ
jgi:AMP nucleosidase